MPEATEPGFARAARLWHTLRWLKPVQFWGRAWFRLHRPQPDMRSAPPVRPALGAWLPCGRAPSMTGPTRFRFLSVEHELTAPGDWDRSDWPRLWRYNLHYFDDLSAQGASDRASWHRALIERWITDNPPGRGTGWEPYPASLRIVNWIKWGLADRDATTGVPSGLPQLAVHSLAVQARWLRQRLEIHLLGNHLWANAKALVFAGAFFDGPEAKAWLDKGLALMEREVKEQILPDGGHFERSPMYHAILLEDLLDLVQLGDRYPGVLPSGLVAAWRETAARMLAWLRVMTHPDGGIAFFNDAALGVAPSLAALDAYADVIADSNFPSERAAPESAEGPAVLQESGYARLQCGAAVLIADIGPLGPDYLPGHAHADTLSFELSIGKRRIIVNSGISTYDSDEKRTRQRGTAAHSTVIVDGEDSSEVWGGFRVARRARPLDVRWGRDADGTLWLRAAHDGYRRLAGRVVHQREWRLRSTDLQVCDRLAGRFHSAQARFHLHPGASPADIGADLQVLEVMPSTWHPGFNQAIPTSVLVADLGNEARVVTQFSWHVPPWNAHSVTNTGSEE